MLPVFMAAAGCSADKSGSLPSSSKDEDVASAESAITQSPGATSFVEFESGPVRPLAMSPDGTRLFSVNTPDNTLEVFNITPAGIKYAMSLPVGLEPVAVAARSNTEVWVVNHLSDSVSIVDLSGPTPRVKRTLIVGDEPRDIVFAGSNGRNRAFITCAHRGQQLTDPSLASVTGAGDPQLTTAGVSRADVWAFDATNLGDTLGGTPLKIVQLFGDTPRGLAVSNDGNTVYASIFRSGNKTTTVEFGVVCPNFATTSCTILGTTYPGGSVGPSTNHQGKTAPQVGIIVQYNPSTGHWTDTAGKIWDNAVKFSLPDKDLFAIDANGLYQSNVWSGVGTTLFNVAVNPANGHIYVSNTDSQNQNRFEGPGTYAGTTVQGHLAESRITYINGSTVTPLKLNKHINYATRPAPAGVSSHSLATPLDMAITGDGNTMYVAAYGSSKIGVLSTTALENNTFDPNTISSNYITVSGGGPAGVTLDPARNRLYVQTRFDNSISVVDLTSHSELQHLAQYNPESAAITAGRKFLYDANYTSSNGEASCASCHIFGDMDNLAWDLGNPDGDVATTPYTNILLSAGASLVSPPVNGSGTVSDIHPMKGPMTTQTLRGLVRTGAEHWRGDRAIGYYGSDANQSAPFDSNLSFRNFVVAFSGLVGRSTQLSDADMTSFTNYAMTLTHPPNPVRSLDNSLNAAQAAGKTFYMGCDGADSVTTLPASCNSAGFPNGAGHRADGIPFASIGETCQQCHTLDAANGYFGTSGLVAFDQLEQTMKVPQLRNMYAKVGMFGTPATATENQGNNGFQGDQVRGFGFLHEGSIDTIFRFFQGTVFNSASSGLVGFSGSVPDTQRRNVEQFMLAYDSDLAPVVGQQVTLSARNWTSTQARINLLEARAKAPFASYVLGSGVNECELVARERVRGVDKQWLYRSSSGMFEADDGSGTLGDAALRAQAIALGAEITFTCVPPGSGVRVALDRDMDNVYNELDSCPANASCSAVCSAGTANCDQNDTNGCEVNTATSVSNCGACGNVCSFANAGASCSAGTCQMGACQSGWIDCDGNPANGCEHSTAVEATCQSGRISVGYMHTCAITGAGAMGCWGGNWLGQLGDGTTNQRNVPVSSASLTDAIQIAASEDWTCAVRSGGQVSCWGYNSNGQLGNNTTTNSNTPVAVSGISNAIQVAAGTTGQNDRHACAILANNTVDCWGLNSDGQLGNGSTTDAHTPVAVSGMTAAVDVAPGRNHTCAVVTGGTVKCWGKNDQGQLGTGNNTNSTSPVSVSSISSAIHVTSGRDYSCAVLSGGGVQCWGNNSNGQLGNNTTTTSNSPVTVQGVTDAVRISAGDQTTCALRTGGTVVCWGRNDQGQIGDGTTTDRHVATAVSGVSNILDIGVGGYHACAMSATGHATSCWGANSYGGIGDSTTTQRNTAVSASGFPLLAPDPSCKYDAYNGHSYWYCNTSKTWNDARDNCFTAGADLVSIHNATEQAHIQSVASGTWYSIGTQDLQTSGTWKWVDGSGATYTNWASGQPDNGATNNCAEMQGGGTWQDNACTNTQNYICYL